MFQPLCLFALRERVREVRLSSSAHSRGSPTYWGLSPPEALLAVVRERRAPVRRVKKRRGEHRRGSDERREERGKIYVKMVL
jgi:hypothetical protein